MRDADLDAAVRIAAVLAMAIAALLI